MISEKEAAHTRLMLQRMNGKYWILVTMLLCTGVGSFMAMLFENRPELAWLWFPTFGCMVLPSFAWFNPYLQHRVEPIISSKLLLVAINISFMVILWMACHPR